MLDFFEEMGYTCRVSEVWLSLVERRVRDAEAASSNLVTSTIKAKREASPLFLLL